ncbi:hypothetical protein ACX31A_12040 [Dermacoccus nishinomiyaensis]
MIKSSTVRASTMTYLLPWEDTIYPDATVRGVEMPDNAEDVLGGQQMTLVTVAKGRALLAGSSRSSGKTLIALTNGSGSARIGSPLKCDMGQPTGRVQGQDQDRTDFRYSPNQQWAVLGQALVNLKTGQTRCLSGLSSAKVQRSPSRTLVMSGARPVTRRSRSSKVPPSRRSCRGFQTRSFQGASSWTSRATSASSRTSRSW